MINAKTLFQSKVFRGAIITGSVIVAKQLGYDIYFGDKNELIEMIIQIVGLFIVIYGRIVAKKTIK